MNTLLNETCPNCGSTAQYKDGKCGCGYIAPTLQPPTNYKRTIIEIEGQKYTLATYNEPSGDLKSVLFHLNGRKVKKI